MASKVYLPASDNKKKVINSSDNGRTGYKLDAASTSSTGNRSWVICIKTKDYD